MLIIHLKEFFNLEGERNTFRDNYCGFHIKTQGGKIAQSSVSNIG